VSELVVASVSVIMSEPASQLVKESMRSWNAVTLIGETRQNI